MRLAVRINSHPPDFCRSERQDYRYSKPRFSSGMGKKHELLQQLDRSRVCSEDQQGKLEAGAFDVNPESRIQGTIRYGIWAGVAKR